MCGRGRVQKGKLERKACDFHSERESKRERERDRLNAGERKARRCTKEQGATTTTNEMSKQCIRLHRMLSLLHVQFFSVGGTEREREREGD